MLSEGSRDDNMVLKPSNINNQVQKPGVVEIDATPPLHQ
jgi:hypothetical protein